LQRNDGHVVDQIVGRFEGKRGEFHADDHHEGTPVRCRFAWTVLYDDTTAGRTCETVPLACRQP
jgi:hypothetical protein